jgi:hypothetical protein
MKKKFLPMVILALLLAGCYSSGEKTAHTPIPTLVRATLPAPSSGQMQSVSEKGLCKITALDLIGAWVKAGKPESEPFPFKSDDGKDCLGKFSADVQPLFSEPNLWYQGAIACTACHGADVKVAAASMSLGSYAGLLAGSYRDAQGANGTDILSADWEKSTLYTKIFTRQMPVGRPPNSPQKGPTIMAGTTK